MDPDPTKHLEPNLTKHLDLDLTKHPGSGSDQHMNPDPTNSWIRI